MPDARKPPRPSWALAYILQDWRRRPAVRTAYKIASANDDIENLGERPSDETFTAVREARDKLAAYIRALDSVLADWDA